METREIRVILTFSVVLFLLTFPYFHLPPFWDGISFISHAILTPKKHYDLSFAHYGHPPIFFWIFGSILTIFGYSNIVIHILMFLFANLIIIFTYKVSKILFNDVTALSASLLLLFSPLFIATTINPNLDLVMTTFIVLSYYFFLKQKFLAYSIFATFGSMTKETGVLWIITVWISFVISKFPKITYRDGRRNDYLSLFYVSLPLFITALWGLYNKITFGWYIYPRRHPLLDNTPLLHSGVYKALSQFFLINFNWLFSLFILVFIIKSLHKTKLHIFKKILIKSVFSEKSIKLLPLLLLFLLYLLVIVPIDDFKLPRYSIILYPFFFIIVSFSLTKIFRLAQNVFLVIGAFLILLFIQNISVIDPIMLSFYKPNLDTGSELEYNMEFTKYVWLEVQGFKYLKNNINGRTILFDWWNPLHAIESAKNHKGIDFGYGFNSSWKFKWVREFRKNTTYVYFTHKLNNDYEFLKQMCNLSLEFSSKLDDKGIWIYNVEC